MDKKTVLHTSYAQKLDNAHKRFNLALTLHKWFSNLCGDERLFILGWWNEMIFKARLKSKEIEIPFIKNIPLVNL